MKPWFNQPAIRLGAVSLLVFGFASCKGKDEETPTTTDPQVGVVSEDAFYVKPLLADGMTSGTNYYFHEQSSLTSECSINSSSAKKDMYCILDINELDLYFNGLTLQFNAPSSLCEYTRWTTYAFFGLRPGVGPATAIQAEGGPAPKCAYDYSDSEGPNCCEGDYTLEFQPSDGSPSTYTPANWGGKIVNCLRGPALDKQTHSKDGWPLIMYSRTKGVGQNMAIELAAPISKGLPSNLYLANYFNAGGAARTASYKEWSSTDIRDGNITWPRATLPGTLDEIFLAGHSLTNYSRSMAFYEYGCMNRADDYISRIRVMIRSFDKIDTFSAAINPYTTGNETAFPEQPWHDMSTWQNYPNPAPTGTYPGMEQ